MPHTYTDMGAEISPCELYRYALWRVWGPGDRRVAWIGLNPSTADGKDDDQTINRCVSFSMREGFDGLFMLNLFAFRATLPPVMEKAVDPIGPENDAKLREYLAKCQMVIACWGKGGEFKFRNWHVRKVIERDIYCLGRTNGGHPRHPARLPGNTPLELFCEKASDDR